MSLIAESSYLDSNWNPESSYADSENGHPTRETSIVYSTPMNHSEPRSSISQCTRDEFAKLCDTFYQLCGCLLMQKDSPTMLEVSHVVHAAAKNTM
jgi:hypothetical protein